MTKQKEDEHVYRTTSEKQKKIFYWIFRNLSLMFCDFFRSFFRFCSSNLLILEAGFFPNCVSDPTEIPTFQGSPCAFVHREGGNPRPRHLPSQKLVRRDPHPVLTLVVAVQVDVVNAIPMAILPVLVPQDLRPVRNAHRQRGRIRSGQVVGRVCKRRLGGGLLWKAGARNRLAELFGRVGAYGVVDVWLIEFECRLVSDIGRVVVSFIGKEAVARSSVVTFTGRHGCVFEDCIHKAGSFDVLSVSLSPSLSWLWVLEMRVLICFYKGSELRTSGLMDKALSRNFILLKLLARPPLFVAIPSQFSNISTQNSHFLFKPLRAPIFALEFILFRLYFMP